MACKTQTEMEEREALGFSLGGGGGSSSSVPSTGVVGAAKDRPSLDIGPSSGAPPLNSLPPRGREPSRGTRRSASRVSLEKRSWSSLFTSNIPQSNSSLEFIPSTVFEGNNVAIMEEEDSSELEEAWRFAIMRYCIGLRPSFKPLEAYIHQAWRPKGTCELFMRDNGFFLCVFNLEEDLNRILEGFWTIRGHPLILRRWQVGLEMEKESLSSIPIWVRFPNLPLRFWTAKGLSKISSTIGKPLYMDNLTAQRKRLSYARVCVMVEAEAELPDSISIIDASGKSEVILISYDWKPVRCSLCASFGHADKECEVKSGKQRKVWRKKTIKFTPEEHREDQACIQDADVNQANQLPPPPPRVSIEEEGLQIHLPNPETLVSKGKDIVPPEDTNHIVEYMDMEGKSSITTSIAKKTCVNMDVPVTSLRRKSSRLALAKGTQSGDSIAAVSLPLPCNKEKYSLPANKKDSFEGTLELSRARASSLPPNLNL